MAAPPIYPEILKLSMLCTPDWRWQRAATLADRGRRSSPKWDDAETLDLLAYLRSTVRQKGDRKGKGEVRWEGLDLARSIQADDGFQRWDLEARFLVREDETAIASAWNLPMPVVRWFAVAFFDLSDRIRFPDWIMHQAIGFPNRTDKPPFDVGWVMRHTGYFCGSIALDAVRIECLHHNEEGWPYCSRSRESPDQRSVRRYIAHQLLPNHKLLKLHKHLRPSGRSDFPSKAPSFLPPLLANGHDESRADAHSLERLAI